MARRALLDAARVAGFDGAKVRPSLLCSWGSEKLAYGGGALCRLCAAYGTSTLCGSSTARVDVSLLEMLIGQ